MLGVVVGLLRGRSVPRTGLKQLTSKRAGKGFYKGKGCRTMGRHTRKGGYILMEEKMPTYVVPDLTDFKRILSPRLIHKIQSSPRRGEKSH